MKTLVALFYLFWIVFLIGFSGVTILNSMYENSTIEYDFSTFSTADAMKYVKDKEIHIPEDYNDSAPYFQGITLSIIKTSYGNRVNGSFLEGHIPTLN